MAARTRREAQRLSSFCNFAVLFLLISGLFVLTSFALTSYTRRELLGIGEDFTSSFITNLRLIPEIARTTEASHSTRPGGSARRRRRDRKQRRGKRGGLRAKLKLTPLRLSLPSIFLANVRSLVNKMDELRLRITHSTLSLRVPSTIKTGVKLCGTSVDISSEISCQETERTSSDGKMTVTAYLNGDMYEERWIKATADKGAISLRTQSWFETLRLGAES